MPLRVTAAYAIDRLVSEMMAQEKDAPKKPLVLDELTIGGVVNRIKEIRDSRNSKVV